MSYFDAAQEELEAEFWGRYDYMTEAFGAEARALTEMARLDAEQDWIDGCVAEQDAIEARGGPRFLLPYGYEDIPF